LGESFTICRTGRFGPHLKALSAATIIYPEKWHFEITVKLDDVLNISAAQPH
jgi:hypothetical protein